MSSSTTKHTIVVNHKLYEQLKMKAVKEDVPINALINRMLWIALVGRKL